MSLRAAAPVRIFDVGPTEGARGSCAAVTTVTAALPEHPAIRDVTPVGIQQTAEPPGVGSRAYPESGPRFPLAWSQRCVRGIGVHRGRPERTVRLPGGRLPVERDIVRRVEGVGCRWPSPRTCVTAGAAQGRAGRPCARGPWKRSWRSALGNPRSGDGPPRSGGALRAVPGSALCDGDVYGWALPAGLPVRVRVLSSCCQAPLGPA